MWDYNKRLNNNMNMSSESQKKEGGAVEVFREKKWLETF